MKNGVRLLAGFGLSSSLLLGSCTKEEAPKPAAPKPASAAPSGTNTAHKDLTTTGTQAAAPREACIKGFGTAGLKRRFHVEGRSFLITGSQVVEEAKDADDQVVLGVMANIDENTPENLANLDALLAIFKKEKVDALVVDGDLGETQAQIEAVLDRIATAKLPTFVIIGNREGVKDFDAALEAATARFEGFVNLKDVRLVLLDDAALIALPGYYNPTYIHAKDGCAYSPSDVDAIRLFMEHAEGRPLVMVSHGPPRQEGAEALDRTLEQVNVGDPTLATFLRETDIHFGIFANIKESGGRATDVTGTKLLPQGKMLDEIFMNPGSVDSVRWKMNDGTESAGMGAVLTIKGKQGSFKVHRLK